MGNILKKYNLTKAQWEVVGGAITGDTLPIGAIIPFGGTEAPTGWLICDGSMLNRETYKELFAAIGTNFGTDGPGNFYIPDLRGKVAVGQDTTDSDFGMGAVGGSKYIQDHQHLGIKWAGLDGININMNAGTGGVQIEPKSWNGGDGTSSPIYSGKVHGTPTGNSGNLQPYQVTNYIIKAFQSAGVVAQVSNTKSDSTTDTYSCDYINGINKYSTEEKVIGEWIDGKPLYRKVYTSYELLGEAPTRYLVLDTDESKEIINNYGSLKIGTFDTSIPTADAGLGYVSPLQKNSSNQIYLTTSATKNLGDLKYVVEYTKTTD